VPARHADYSFNTDVHFLRVVAISTRYSRRQGIQILQRFAELAPVDPETDQQLPDLPESDIPLRTLHRPHESAIEMRLIREPFLRIPGRSAKRPDHLGQR
jgi:hypothetical protein